MRMLRTLCACALALLLALGIAAGAVAEVVTLTEDDVTRFGGTGSDAIGGAGAEMPDGGLLIVGHTQSGDGDLAGRNQSGVHTAWAIRLDRDGEVLWDLLYRQKAEIAQFDAAVALADGTALVAYQGYGGADERRLLHLSEDGQILSDVELPAHILSTYAGDGGIITMHREGQVQVRGAAKEIPVFTFYGPDGEARWQSAIPELAGAGFGFAPYEGGYALSGSYESRENSDLYALAARLRPDGTLAWHRPIPMGEFAILHGSVALSDGTLLMLGESMTTREGEAKASIVRLSPEGSVLSQETLDLGGGAYFEAIAREGSGAIGFAPGRGGTNHIIHLDAEGKVTGQNTLQLPETMRILYGHLYRLGDQTVSLSTLMIEPVDYSEWGYDHDIALLRAIETLRDFDRK